MQLLLFVFLLNSFAFINAQQSIYRLSKLITPTLYNVTLYPNFEVNGSYDYDFEGWEYITINISCDYLNSSDDPFEIRIHQGSSIEITNVTLVFANNDTTYSATSYIFNEETEITNISFPVTNNQLLSSSSYIIGTLFIKYIGAYQGGFGIFVSSYTYNNILIQNVATQFETIFARTTFPCFDEPAMKSRFTFTFIAPINSTVLYNTQIDDIIVDTNGDYSCYYEYANGAIDTKCKIVSFEISPIMSTYLNTFIVGDYQVIEGINPYLNISHNLYYPWNQVIDDAQWSYNASLFSLYYFGQSELFNYSYTRMLPKLDDIAITGRPFAMEHWGLITYDTRRLMTNPLSADLEQKIQCSLVIGHEVVHQWFGNLVTCEWWSNIFINEGFGRYLEYWSSDAVHPEINVYDYRARRTNDIMNSDVTKYTHSINLDEDSIQTPAQCSSVFDGIVYDKAASILKMVDNFMGRDAFIKASKQFLNVYQYGNANADDLIDTFAPFYDGYSGNTNFAAFFSSWLNLEGFPVLNVAIKYDDTDATSISMTVTQSRLIKKNVNNAIYDELWYIPLMIETSVSGTQYKLGTFNETIHEFNITRVLNNFYNNNNAEYYLFNTELINHFRTSYDSNAMDLITAHFRYISFWSQYNIIADYAALMEYSYIEGVSYLDLLYKINNSIQIANQDREELSFQIWEIIIESLYVIDEKICQIIDDSDANVLNNFRVFARDLLNPVYEDINKWYENATDTEHIIKLRAILISALIRFDDINVIDYGYNLLSQFIIDHNGTIPLSVDGYINQTMTSNLIKQIFQASLSFNDYNILNNLLSIFDNLNAEQQTLLLQSFDVLYKNDNFTQIVYDFILNDMDASLMVEGFNYLSTCSNLEMLWNKFESDTVWDALYLNGFSITTLIQIPIKFVSQSKENKVRDFYFGQNDLMNSYGAIINSTLEQIGSNIVWVMQNQENMSVYLEDYLKVDDDKNELETWQIVLIVIGSIFAILNIIGGIVFCAVKRQRQKDTGYSKHDDQAKVEVYDLTDRPDVVETR